MKRISRTRHINLDRMFHWINLDLEIQIKQATLPCKSQASKTRGSLCREEWSHLTQFLNLMTPHMDSCNNSWVFSCVQKGDKMSERQADPIAESATAKQTPVRNLCAYAPHALKFKLPMEHSWDIFRANGEQTGVEK